MILENKIALVTGAGGGIGRAIVKRFINEGALVIGGDLDSDKLEKLQNELSLSKSKLITLKFDVSDGKDVQNAFRIIKKDYGRLDILVNNAGICNEHNLFEITSEEWDLFLKVNLKSVFLCSQEALKMMIKQSSGRIINIGSAAGKIGGIAVGAHYSSAKAGVLCLTKSLARIGAKYNICVNAIAPGPIKTAMTEIWNDDTKSDFLKQIPLNRFGNPEEVAEVVLFLSSEKAGYITGEIIDVNGGLLMD